MQHEIISKTDNIQSINKTEKTAKEPLFREILPAVASEERALFLKNIKDIKIIRRHKPPKGRVILKNSPMESAYFV